jgi:hypothetical protein
MSVAHMHMHDYESASRHCGVLISEVDKYLSSNDKKDKDLVNWLKLFKPMVVQFSQSVRVKQERPANIKELDDMIHCALDKVAASAGTTYDRRERLSVNLNYRTQYNTACYFSRCYDIAKQLSGEEAKDKAEDYAERALDYLRLALGHGGGLTQYARKDQALRPLRTYFEADFNKIAPKPEEPKPQPKAADPVTRFVLDEPEVDYVNLLPGITAEQVQAFQTLSIRSRSDLLLSAVNMDARKALQKKTKVEMEQLLWWLNLCDLTRIAGLDLYSAVLLEHMGKVDSVKELRKCDAEKLYKMLEKRIAKETLLEWISSARDLIPSLEYRTPGKPKNNIANKSKV